MFALCDYFGLPLLAILFVSNVLGVFFNYFSFGLGVFKIISTTIFIRFIICYSLLIVLNWISIEVLITIGVSSNTVAQAVVFIPIALISLLISKFYIFRS